MATITGLTADRMLEIEAASVVDGDIVGNDLVLARHDGSIINAGNVRGPAGPTGPMGSALAVLSAAPVLEIGQVGQIRAGRQLSPSDFTNMGLNAPVGLWNLSNANDSSGNARNLSNKGTVPFTSGINGAATTAAQFVGSTGQVLYIPDTGAADPFRLKTGSIGCWFRTGRRGVSQAMMGKWDENVAGRRGISFLVSTTNTAALSLSADGALGTVVSIAGVTDLADDRWHFVVGTWDGSKLRLYVDGVLEGGPTTFNGPLFGSVAPFTIGGLTGDSVTATAYVFYGRVDEAFMTMDVLSLEEIRNLMSASIPHALGAVPSSIRTAVRRKRRGAALATTDFPAQPLRLYNFTNGNLIDQGSQNVPLTLTAGVNTDIAGADGASLGGGKYLNGSSAFKSSDAGLPSALTPRSYGVWFKITVAGNFQMMAWGGATTGCILRTNVSGMLGSDNGTDLLGFRVVVTDGVWHHAVVVEDNAAADGAKRKLYLDGKLSDITLVMQSVTLLGANGFRIGDTWQGSLSRPFVYGGVLTADQVRALYNVGSQALAPKPRDEADYVEAVELSRLLGIFNAVEGSDALDLAVMG